MDHYSFVEKLGIGINCEIVTHKINFKDPQGMHRACVRGARASVYITVNTTNK
jgi:hypothetical protein